GEGGAAEVGGSRRRVVRCLRLTGLSVRQGDRLLLKALLLERKALFGQCEGLLLLCKPLCRRFSPLLGSYLLVLELNSSALDARHLLDGRHISVDRAGELLVEPQFPLLGLCILLRQPS